MGKYTLPRDEKARASEQGKARLERKSTHFLETRKRGKVSEARISDRGKAHADYRQEGKSK